MHLKNRRVMFLGLLVLAVLLLLGAGCKREEASAPPQDSGQPVFDASEPAQDNGPEIPEGGRVYRSPQWGVSIAYPPGWYSREANITSGELTVFFDSNPIPVELTLEPVFAVGVTVKREMIDSARVAYTGLESLPAVVIGGATWERYRYFSDLLEQNDVVYLRGFDDRVVSVVADETTVASTNFTSILQYMEVQ